jgi:hypothetical protein
MRRKLLFSAISIATLLGAAAIVRSIRRSSSTSTTTGTDTPTTPDPDPAPRSATRDELAALLRRYMREPRTGGGHAVSVTRLPIPSGGISRKDAWFYRLSPDQQVMLIIVLYEQYDLSHGQISKLVPLSARAIGRVLRDAGAVRYSDRPHPAGRPLAA